MGLSFGRLATFGLLAGLAGGAYAWMQSTPEGRRTLHRMERRFQGRRMPSFMGTMTEGTRDFLERGSDVVTRQYGYAQPTLRRAGEMSGTFLSGAAKFAEGLWNRLQHTVLPATGLVRRMRGPEDLEDITGERREWRPRRATTRMPTIGLGLFFGAIGRFVMGLFQMVLTALLWIGAVAAFIVFVYRPEQFRLETFEQALTTAYDSVRQWMGWLMDQVRGMTAGQTGQTEYGRRAA